MDAIKQVRALLEQAARDKLTTLEVLHRLADEEKASRLRSAVERRIHDARFPEANTVDGFDFNFEPYRKKLRARYLALHDLAFLEKGINPLFIGYPGTGKTFLARALAYRACQANRRVVFISAPKMLNDLHGAELHGGLERKLRRYVYPEFGRTRSTSRFVSSDAPAPAGGRHRYPGSDVAVSEKSRLRSDPGQEKMLDQAGPHPVCRGGGANDDEVSRGRCVVVPDRGCRLRC